MHFCDAFGLCIYKVNAYSLIYQLPIILVDAMHICMYSVTNMYSHYENIHDISIAFKDCIYFHDFSRPGNQLKKNPYFQVLHYCWIIDCDFHI